MDDDDDDRTGGSCATVFCVIPIHIFSGLLLVTAFLLRPQALVTRFDLMLLGMGLLWLLAAAGAMASLYWDLPCGLLETCDEVLQRPEVHELDDGMSEASL